MADVLDQKDLKLEQKDRKLEQRAQMRTLALTTVVLSVGLALLWVTKTVVGIEGDAVFIALLLVPFVVYLAMTGKRTETDARLPAPQETWEELASRLEVQLDTSGIETLADPGEIVRALCDPTRRLRCVEIAKDRSSLLVPPGRVEVAEVVVAGAVFQSIAFESRTLASARSLRSQLWAPELGVPENYVSFSSRSPAAGPSLPR